jgi:predicted nucleic acid binding AN1-type Zn finger protein
MSNTDTAPAADIYKSSAAGRSYLARRDERGRFLSQRCDRIGCEAPREACGGRFCAEHRQAHGRRLHAQITAIADR